MKIRSIIIWLVVIILLIGYIYYQRDQQKKKELDRIEQIKQTPTPTLSDTYSDYSWNDFYQIRTLLAYKYDIDTSMMSDFILEYLFWCDPIEYFILAMDYNFYDSSCKHREDNPVLLSKAIPMLSEKYHLSPDTTAMVLFDYISFDNLQYTRDNVHW